MSLFLRKHRALLLHSFCTASITNTHTEQSLLWTLSLVCFHSSPHRRDTHKKMKSDRCINSASYLNLQAYSLSPQQKLACFECSQHGSKVYFLGIPRKQNLEIPLGIVSLTYSFPALPISRYLFLNVF